MTKKSRIAIVLDRSGSMASIRASTISAFNEQVQAIKKNAAEIDTKVSLFTFSTIADAPLIWNRSVEELAPLTLETYVPDGMTAMYDSVGMAVNLLAGLPEANDKDTSFLVVIVSDGAENNSANFNSQRIATLVKHFQGTDRWTFTYLGANQDLTQVQRDLGIHAGNTQVFAANDMGMVRASASNAAGIGGYFAAVNSGATSVKNFYSAADKTTDAADEPVVTGTAKTY